MAGRELLELDVIQEQDQERELSLLTEEEVYEYLEKAANRIGIDNSMLWKENMYKKTRGHPLSLSIIRELWDEEDENPSSDEDEDIAELQSKFDEKVSTEFVEKRILKRLPSPFRELTEYGVLLRSFSLPQLKTLFPDLLPESEAADVFDQFIHYSYIESKGGYRYTFHEFVREVLAKHAQKEHPEEWQYYHEVASRFHYSPRRSAGFARMVLSLHCFQRNGGNESMERGDTTGTNCWKG